jgi:hypothetical protein
MDLCREEPEGYPYYHPSQYTTPLIENWLGPKQLPGDRLVPLLEAASQPAVCLPRLEGEPPGHWLFVLSWYS